MIAADGDTQGFAEQFAAYDVGILQGQPRQRDVQIAGLNPFHQPARRIFGEVDLDVGILITKLTESRRKKEGKNRRNRADPKAAADALLHRSDSGCGGRYVMENGLGLGEQRVAKRGQSCSSAQALEERNAELGFELPDLLG